MCGRFSQAYSWDEIVAFSQPLTVPADRPNLRARYNITPTTEIDIIVRTEAGRELRKARWGFIPAWWKEAANKVGTTFNARVEGVADSRMFRSAYVKRRCVIPASAFYEWTGPKGERIPHRISAADGGLLAFAGMWERWTDPATGEEVISCTIITRAADRWMSKLHDRMPAMLNPKNFDAWLDGSGGRELLEQPPPELREWIVSTRVNSNRAPDDDPTLADPVGPDEAKPELKTEPPAQGDLF
ncbi:SOS response-associated peptidase [Bosea sp. (in: a-proteobacteria)]|uniref:SOS response-associated peptidase n=1 Tax=Bosea sp. (in: a-proteobacteria) TaxID=1871050 RepID=UPI001AC1CC3D|nr:SOS response-associated peptidase [Bosea sp. (in: a-proteobacteria)]MBN9443707.1 SOS response-associated peptidase [Bosea sp. (in: a-proteobacteria)]